MKLNILKNFKIICLMLIVIILVNVFVPICSFADEDEDFGGVIFKPISKLLCALGDISLSELQKWIMGMPSMVINSGN